MWLTVLVLIVGLALQIGGAYLSHRILERWAPIGYGSRSCYFVSTLCGVLIVGIPCGVAGASGLLSPAACVYAGGLVLFGLGLLFNAGHLAEAGAIACVCIWIGVFMLPAVHSARERAMQQQQPVPQGVSPTQ